MLIQDQERIAKGEKHYKEQQQELLDIPNSCHNEVHIQSERFEEAQPIEETHPIQHGINTGQTLAHV